MLIMSLPFVYFLSGSPDFVFFFSGPDVGSIVGQPAYFEELKSEMAELYGSLAEQVRSRQTVFLPDPDSVIICTDQDPPTNKQNN
jgi:hypothetical protein